MRVARIRTGRVHGYDAPFAWVSAIAKSPVTGAVVVGPLGIAGDEQADRVNHGGPDKAILCYARAHYAAWAAELGSAAPPPGTLGENLEIEGLTEETVCVGDVWRIGDSVVAEVSQPRQPCWKPATLHGMPDLTARILKSGRTGWYVRVREGGAVEAPAEMTLIERPHPEWTVARATRVMHFSKDPAARAELGRVAALAAAWKAELV